MYKGNPQRLPTCFSTEIFQGRGEWHDVFKVLKGKNLQPRILCSAKLSFRIKRDEKLLRQAKIKGFIETKSALRIVKGSDLNEREKTTRKKKKGKKRIY